MTNLGGATNTYKAQSRNIINTCTKYGFDTLFLVVKWTQTTHAGRWMTDNRQCQGYDLHVRSPQVSQNIFSGLIVKIPLHTCVLIIPTAF